MRKSLGIGIFLALVLLASQSEAQMERCMHFTNFCDTITLQKSGDLAYGGWDFQCGGDWISVNIIGNMKSPAELATHPLDDGYPSIYTTQFSFSPPNLFRLDASYGIGHDVLTFEEGSYSITKGACSFHDINRDKPRLMANLDWRSGAKSNSQAATHCMHFKNFCDTIVFSISGALAYGAWDWQCSGDWTSSYIMGNAKAGRELATRPRIDDGPYLAPYSLQFQFKAGSLFDLYGTTGTGQGVFTARSNQPFDVTDGFCGPGDVDTSKPRLMAH
ncbi:MAG: hypothetical protein ACRD3L_15015 [Terriglobales bacterium]